MPCALVVMIMAPLQLHSTTDNDPNESTRIITKARLHNDAAAALLRSTPSPAAPRHHDRVNDTSYNCSAVASPGAAALCHRFVSMHTHTHVMFRSAKFWLWFS